MFVQVIEGRVADARRIATAVGSLEPGDCDRERSASLP